MAFSLTPNVHVRRDEDDLVRQIRHLQEPYDAPGVTTPTPQSLSAAYLKDVAAIYDFEPATLATLGDKVGDKFLQNEGSHLRFSEEKKTAASRVVGYSQTHRGLPVWHRGASVTMEDDPRRVTSSASSFLYDVKVEDLDPDAQYVPRNEEGLAEALKGLARLGKAKLLAINSAKLVIYRFDPSQRVRHDHGLGETAGKDGAKKDTKKSTKKGTAENILDFVTTLPRTIKDGQDYIATEVFFALAIGPWKKLYWHALVEVNTGAILYHRPGVSGVDGLVFRYDPQSLANDATINPCSSNAVLNPLRESVTLQGLTAPGPGADQALTGNYITLGEQSTPTIAPPTEPVGTNFDYDANTDDFSAVGCYWHCDEAFRFIDAMPGISVATYMGGTTFPVTVDHRDDSLGTVNALAYPNATFTGSGGFGFNLAQAGCALGIIADFRLAWHELCHGLLLDHVEGFNFGFAHSAGDSLGVILSDWKTPTIDRFDTFPFIIPSIRRHDQDVTAGGAWGGSNDVGGYPSESILATTLFRFYRSIGGDSTTESQRKLAADHSAYLIIGAIGTLTPATNPTEPDGFATALMDFDLANDYNGISRGALHKVMRWAFEQQGLYQPPGAPVPVVSAGDPPAVDVYIDDGRAGTYEYQRNFWNSQHMWNRLAADGMAAHETPVVGQTNYMYVRVSNRGTQVATNVTVDAYHCTPGTGLVFPDDWQAMTTATLPGADIPSGGSVVVGPFEWTPTTVGHECLLALADATGDLANDTTAINSIPHWRFVPFDNNIGQRNVAPVAGGGGASGLMGSFEKRQFLFRNPEKRAVAGRIEAQLPDFLKERGWELRFGNRGGERFTLGPKEKIQIHLSMVQGKSFGPKDVPKDLEKRAINVLAYVDEILVGGMTYDVDPELTKPARETGEEDPDRRPKIVPTDEPCADNPTQRGKGSKTLDSFDIPEECLKRAKVKKICVEIDLDDCC